MRDSRCSFHRGGLLGVSFYLFRPLCSWEWFAGVVAVVVAVVVVVVELLLLINSIKGSPVKNNIAGFTI